MELSDYKKWLVLSFDEFVAKEKIQIHQLHDNLRYEKIVGVIRVDVDDQQFVFFKNDTLKIIYISDDIVAEKLWAEFKKSIDAEVPEKNVRSRAGKTSNQLVFASHGFTASLTDNRVDFIELYPPCSLEEYLVNVYREPGLFIR